MDSCTWNESKRVFLCQLLESCMNSALLAELHEAPVGPPCQPVCVPLDGQPQHGAYWLVPPSQMGVTGNLDKRALHHFLQFTNNDVKQERSQDRPAALRLLPAPRNKVYYPLTTTLWAQPSKKAAYTSSCPPIQTEFPTWMHEYYGRQHGKPC